PSASPKSVPPAAKTPAASPAGTKVAAPTVQRSGKEKVNALSATAPAAKGESGEGATARLSTANRLVQQNEFRKAIDVCLEVLQKDPGSAQAYRTLGIAYGSLGGKTQSCEAYRRYLHLAPAASDRAQI